MRRFGLGSTALVVAAFSFFAVTFASSCKTNTIDNDTTNNAGDQFTIVGPSGGIVQGPEGSSLRVPAGALTKDTAISIRVSEPGQYPPLSATLAFASKVFAFEPHGLEFLSPAIVTLPLGGGTSPPYVGLWAPPNGAWSELPAQVAAQAEISTTHFSFYAVGTRTAAEGADGGGGTVGDSGIVDTPDAGDEPDAGNDAGGGKDSGSDAGAPGDGG